MIFDHPGIKSLEKLPHDQRFSLVALAIITISIPLSVWTLGMSTRTTSKAASPLTIPVTLPTPKTLPDAAQFRHYSAQIMSTNPGPLRLEGLPPGIYATCNDANTASICHLNGSPQTYGMYTLTTEKAGRVLETYRLTVNRSLRFWYLPRWLTSIFSLK